MKRLAKLSLPARHAMPITAAVLGLVLPCGALGQTHSPSSSTYGEAGALHAEAKGLLAAGHHASAARLIKHALEQDPSDADALLSLGWVHIATGEFRDALQAFSASAELRPNCAECFGGRAVAYAYLQDYASAGRDLTAAIHLNPGDAGVSLLKEDDDLSQPKRLEEKQLWHGRAQLAELVNDRPQVRPYLEESGEIAQWVIRAFAGEATERVVYWDRSATTSGEAENYVRQDGNYAIRVGPTWRRGELQGRSKRGNLILAQVIYELMNVRNQPAFADVDAAAKSGSIDRDAYILAYVRLEHTATQKTRAFYARFVLPWAAEHEVPVDPYGWYLTQWLTAEQYMAQLTPNEAAYPWFPYGLNFDWRTARRQMAARKFDEALGTCERLLINAPWNQRGTIYGWAGYCCAATGRVEAAIDYLSKGIRIAPRDAYLRHRPSRCLSWPIAGVRVSSCRLSR